MWEISGVMMHHSVRLLLVVPFLALAACDDTQPPGTPAPNESQQTVTVLTEADHMRIREQRAVVEKFLGDDEEYLRAYKTAVGKLGAIRAFLEAGVFKPEQTYELQCLGIVLGDAFVQELGMEWVMVEDEYGRNPAVRLPKTSIILFPLTMISKRVERGEDVDVFRLFNGIAAQVDELKAKGV